MHNPARRQGLLSTTAGEQLIIFDPVSYQSHCLSPAACKVWQMCDGSHGRDDMIRALSAQSVVVAEIGDDSDINNYDINNYDINNYDINNYDINNYDSNHGNNAEAVVDTALALFAEQNLLTIQKDISRRDFACSLLKPGLAVALMVTLHVPPRAAAAS